MVAAMPTRRGEPQPPAFGEFYLQLATLLAKNEKRCG
jgi:hypothetical protein